jgi:hypothetical protein
MLNDFLNFLRADERLPVFSASENRPVYAAPTPGRMDMQDIERTYARLFASDDGQKVLAHLQVMTFHRAMGPSCPDEQLRYMEGQRAMVASILRLIDRGRTL